MQLFMSLRPPSIYQQTSQSREDANAARPVCVAGKAHGLRLYASCGTMGSPDIDRDRVISGF